MHGARVRRLLHILFLMRRVSRTVCDKLKGGLGPNQANRLAGLGWAGLLGETGEEAGWVYGA